MNNSKFAKKIEKYYYSHDQHLIIDTWEMIQNTEDDCCFDVYLKDSDILLFTIQNYNGLRDLRVINTNYFKDPKCEIINIWDSAKASYIPLYYDNTFTLKTFKPITKEDMIHATDYYIHKVLDLLLFNIKFAEDTNEE